ncbi:hypothetical protein ZIOFF_007707 [Zingiber officinale]|uniref:RING-type domain-containing protein n=1 Tax=Zingiber officinale TaxID=94328 RepID=A0A8J5I256_ZINOF|nr:hypothetical protein ZIOFF_007707 [Zingiber officinale]
MAADAAPVEDILVDLPLHSIVSRGHRMTIGAQIQQSRMIPTPIEPPRLSIYFSLRTIPPRVTPVEQAGFIFHRSFNVLMNKQAWEREAREILTNVVADQVEPDNLDIFTRAFCWYTSFAILHMMDLVLMEPASVVAVEGLKMVTAEESDCCFICLEDFGMSAQVLAMPCSHLFHATCLKKWLEKSCSCPLCRFSLPEEQ